METCALARRAVDENEPAGLLHNAIGRGQAKPGALTGALGREERLEHLLEFFRRDPKPLVDHLNRHVTPRRNHGAVAAQRL